MQNTIMAKYDIEEIDRTFYRGKRLLDSGYYEDSIRIFSDLIVISEKEKENPDAKVTLDTALNNRGVGFCKLALIRKDKDMYLKGMEDFKRSISSTKSPEEQMWLTAYGNLKFSEKEFSGFDKIKPKENDFFQSI